MCISWTRKGLKAYERFLLTAAYVIPFLFPGWPVICIFLSYLFYFANPGNQKYEQFSGLFGQGVLTDTNFVAQGSKWKYKP